MTTPGAAGKYADGVYDRNAPGQQGAGEAYVSGSGFSSNEERLVTAALMTATDPSKVHRNGGAKGNPFPPRFGYDRTQPGIMDIVSVDRRYPDSSAAFSGKTGSFTGSSTPSLGTW